MLFNSAWFFLFFPAVSLVFAATPAMARIWVLVAAGAVFYMALAPEYIVIPIAMIATCYLAGRAMEDSRSPRWRKAVLVTGLSIHLAILFSFKYAGFALSTAEQAARLAGFDFTWTVRNWILPVGLSFQTFQGISYLMEVCWRNASPERSLGAMALYFLFYPQLPSGPISTPQALLTQFHGWRRADREKAGSGLRLMAWGFSRRPWWPGA